MSYEQAIAIVQAVYGQRAFCHELRRFTGHEAPDADGWVRPGGELYGYRLGYFRKGKRGAKLLTVKGSGATVNEMIEDFRNNTRGERTEQRVADAIKAVG